MKAALKFTVWRDRGISPAAFDDLGMIHPGGVDVERGQFRCDLPMEDERVPRILARLTAHGYRPWAGRMAKQPGEISIRIVRTYDREDFEDAPALLLNPVSRVDSGGRSTGDGRLVLETKELGPKARLSITGTYGLVVAAALKELLEREGLVGLIFRPIELDGPERAVAHRAGQFWELDSGVVLPPMAPRMRYYDAVDGAEVTGDGPPPFVYREGPDFPAIHSEPPELHFTAEAWDGVPLFDLARTHERPMRVPGIPIASPRLYRILAAWRVPVAWVPVRID
ncbi:MAG TPA: hypothetical protein VF590_11125 [Isosphaeraceae bacterium]|jgi:hypothetical protein